MLLLTEAIRRYGSSVEGCHLLSIGMAGSTRLGRVTGSPGKFGWAARHGLIDLSMSAQGVLALRQAEALGPGTFMRIDAEAPEPIALDTVDTPTTELLVTLAHQAVNKLKGTRAEYVRRFLAHVAAREAR